MKMTEAMLLKIGDLVIVDKRNKNYEGLVLEIEDITDGGCCRRVTLKQPKFDNGFRIRNYDTRHLKGMSPNKGSYF